MNTVSRIMAGAFAATAAIATAAVAGGNYEAGPTVGDNAPVAGLLLLVAIGAVLLLNGNKPAPPTEDTTETPPEE